MSNNVMVPPNLADEIVEHFGEQGLREYSIALNNSVDAIRNLEDDVVTFFSINPRAPQAFYAPIYNTSIAVH